MESELQPHQGKIRKVGKILWGFSLFWMIFNSIAFLIVIATLVVFGLMGATEEGEKMARVFAHAKDIPGLEKQHLQALIDWDYANFLDHFWIHLFHMVAGLTIFLVSMTFILRIASSWKRGDVFGEQPIRCFRILGWIYLLHGIIGQVWGMAGPFMGGSKTHQVVYFSFLADVSAMSFITAGTGIEWGILSLTLSWILKHAQLLRQEQALVV